MKVNIFSYVFSIHLFLSSSFFPLFLTPFFSIRFPNSIQNTKKFPSLSQSPLESILFHLFFEKRPEKKVQSVWKMNFVTSNLSATTCNWINNIEALKKIRAHRWWWLFQITHNSTLWLLFNSTEFEFFFHYLPQFVLLAFCLTSNV